MSVAAKRALVERLKHLSGLPKRREVQRLYDMSENEFWEYQRERFFARYADAVAHVPYYSKDGKRYPPILPDRGSVLETIAQLPILPKDVVKSRTAEFWRSPSLFLSAVHTTGGTTGAPLRVRAGLAERGHTNAILEERYRRLVGTRTPRILRLSGLLASSAEGLWLDIPGSQFAYLSIYKLSSVHRAEIVERITAFAPQIIHGYASALSQLSLVLGRDVHLPPFAMISTSETLDARTRDLIETTLGTQVLNEYGSQEGQHLIIECSERAMHIHPARGIVEVLKLDSVEPASSGELGRVVVSGYMARSMPLFRYDIGDTVISTGYRTECPCGSSWPTVGAVYGRTEDLVRMRDGRRVGLLSHSTLKDVEGVEESQIVQTGFENFRYMIKPAMDLNRSELEAHVLRELRNRLDLPVSVEFDYVDSIQRTPSGKLQAVVVHFQEPHGPRG